jgi:hypothetical protein
VYSKFRIVSFADAEIALVVNQVNGPVYAFRMPGAESRREPKSPVVLNVN